MAIWEHIAKSLAAGTPCALVSVTRVDGSAPREAGARMVVLPDNRFSGTIGGGELEFQAIRWATSELAAGSKGLTTRVFSLGPDLGQCCGGRTELALEIFGPEMFSNAHMLAEEERKDQTFFTTATVFNGVVGARSVLRDESMEPTEDAAAPGGTTTATAFSLTGNVLVEQFGVRRRPIYLFGAGHVGKALILAMAPHPFDVTWVDTRKGVFPGVFPPNVTPVFSETPEELLAHAPENAFVLIMTQSHPLDESLCAAAFSRGCFEYVGVIGSKTKRARFTKRLQERGISDQKVKKLVCPIGASALQSKLPAAISASVVVELLIAHEMSMEGQNADLANRTVAFDKALNADRNG